MVNNIPVITIDGPSGSGKGTVSQILAQRLGWHFLDSGALYRVLALAACQATIQLDDEEELEVLALDLDVEFQTAQLGEPAKILLGGYDVTDDIRSELCSKTASKIAALPRVREALLARQRAFQLSPGLIADGRDMGTVIFPQARLKIFLFASAEERARRRHQQLQQKGINVSLAELLLELKERDVRDQMRSVAPLKPAPDAILIDTTALTIDEVVKQILMKFEEQTARAI